MNKKGFTIIEILVVIAVIGLLSTMVQTKYTRAMAKARDADRLNDLKNISGLLINLNMNNPNLFFADPCNIEDASTLTCVGAAQPGDLENQLLKFIDPYFSDAVSANASPCAGGPADTAPCQYSISADGASVSDVTIQFYLEIEASDLSAGPHTMTAEGVFN